MGVSEVAGGHVFMSELMGSVWCCLYRDGREVFLVDGVIAVCYRSVLVARMLRSID
ncbi:hypothetical protein Xfasm12_0610 [Xylella fastidiosa M12]|nr:hypothetical protein Xfasm12_0610 [Xylella fastidiosa M12]